MNSPATATAPTRSDSQPGVPAPFYKPELDALRFFAFFAVFLHHTTPVSVDQYVHKGLPLWAGRFAVAATHLGAVGVDLFFLLSAYLITELLLRERERASRINLRAFYIRRILRIWPVYFASLGLALVAGAFDAAQHVGLRYLIPFLFLAGNWALVVLGQPASMIAILWSISVEEQFYLCWPPLLSRCDLRRLKQIAVFLIAVACVSRWLAAPHVVSDTVLFSTFNRLDSIGLGILVAVMLHKGNHWSPSIAFRSLLLFGGLCAWIAMGGIYFAIPGQGTLLLALYPLFTAGTLSIFLSALNLQGAGLRLLAHRPLVYLGKISYGLYAYHLFAYWIVFDRLRPRFALTGPATFGLSFLLTVGMAALSYRALEQPFLRLKKRFTIVPSGSSTGPQAKSALEVAGG